MSRFTANALLGFLLLGDALFIGADILQRVHVLHDTRFLVTHDRGFGEWFQYCEAALSCFLLGQIGARRSSRTALTWAGLLALVLADDALQLHEHAGDVLASLLGLHSFGALRANQVGELIFYSVVGAGCLAALAAAWWRGDAEDRELSRRLFPWFAALGFCAVILDAADSLLRRTAWGVEFALLEDGGEMIVLSFLTASVWTAFERTRRHGGLTPRQ